MTLGKAAIAALLGIGAVSQQDKIADGLDGAMEVLPIVKSVGELESYAPTIRKMKKLAEIEGYGFSFGGDFSSWLNANFEVSNDKDPGIDFFGTRYQANMEGEEWILRSCGPDKSCHSEDDLKVGLRSGASVSKDLIKKFFGVDLDKSVEDAEQY